MLGKVCRADGPTQSPEVPSRLTLDLGLLVAVKQPEQCLLCKPASLRAFVRAAPAPSELITLPSEGRFTAPSPPPTPSPHPLLCKSAGQVASSKCCVRRKKILEQAEPGQVKASLRRGSVCHPKTWQGRPTGGEGSHGWRQDKHPLIV